MSGAEKYEVNATSTDGVRPEVREFDPREDELRDRAVEAYGTAVVFQKRASRYRRLIASLNFVGLAIPLTIGGIALANLLAKHWFERMGYFAGVLVAIQGIVFLWSVIANWPESLDYSAGASAENIALYMRLKTLRAQIMSPPLPPGFDAAYASLIVRDDDQIKQDFRRAVGESEKIYGYRAALLYLQEECFVCRKSPESMNMPWLWWKRCQGCGGPIA